MARLSPFDTARRVVAAVSGGADSMALAVLLARWGRPLAAIVDHGMRPESAAEAELTATRLRGLGIDTRILRAGLAPGPAAAERARAARYRLLLAACRAAGSADLVLAHHRGDQAETVRLRQEQGSAAAGLAGIAPIAYRNEARLLRPLLGTAPDRLRATVAAARLGHVEDPTNHDPRTGRGRLRAEFGAEARAAALRLAASHGLRRAARERALAKALASASIFPEGYALVPPDLDPDALSALIWTVSGAPYPPPRAALAAGLAPRTVHGVSLHRAGRLGAGTLIVREPDAVEPPIPGAPCALWDRRFRLVGYAPADCQVGALAADAARLRGRSALPSVVLRTLPALRQGEALLAVPHLGIGPGQVEFRFVPQIPLTNGAFVNLPAGIGAVD